MKNRFCEMLGIRYPIIQGGMAWSSDGTLAAAVSNAGGAGIIGTGGRTTEWVEEEIKKAKSLTDKPFGVNLMLMAPNVKEIAGKRWHLSPPAPAARYPGSNRCTKPESK